MALYQMSQSDYDFIVEFANSRENEKQTNESLFWFERKKYVKVDVSFIIYHYKGMCEEELILTLETLYNQEHLPNDFEVEIIIMLDGVRLKDLEYLNNNIDKKQNTIIVDTNIGFAGPGLMWNAGNYISRGKKVCFTWTGVYWQKDSLMNLNNSLKDENCDGVYGQVKFETSNKNACDLGYVGQFEAYSGWLQGSNLIPLCYCLFKRGLVEKLKGFYTDTTICRIVDWEFVLRASTIAAGRLKALKGTPLFARVSLCNVHSDLKFNESIDDIIRFGLRNSVAYSRKKRITNKILNQSFLKSINAAKEGKNKPYKIGIVSDMNDSTQVQVYLLNFFEKLSKKVSWRKFHEQNLNISELNGYDLIFFVRSRSEQAVKAAQFCYKKDINTVYILDENWICETETYPELKAQRGINTSFYQNFILLISTMDYVLLYNDLLWQDVSEYTNQIILLSYNINLEFFKKRNIKNNSNNIRIGYVGSNSILPFCDPAFNALKRIMDKYEEVNLYFHGMVLPEIFEKYSNRITMKSYEVDYAKYTKDLSEAHCDIMVSPLGNTRYLNSKCPYKYLDITAAGAVGIYTNTELYNNLIINEENGLIIENEEEQWFFALESLICDSTLREKLLSNAKEEVITVYETKAVLPMFIQLLQIFEK
ncbi:MAG: hypothetical protein CVV02_11080 [Firmicutes bacterium HGW-Firmicutes-7]|nr:MAG: hypothetical protein CVV02_11080 [Firmicutes bacterium HGW-Firmicutes-7]